MSTHKNCCLSNLSNVRYLRGARIHLFSYAATTPMYNQTPWMIIKANDEYSSQSERRNDLTSRNTRRQ